MPEENIMTRLVNLCLVLVTVTSPVLAQTTKSKTDELREHQLRVLREHVLSRVLDNIRKMDEPGLRVSARNQILTYLTREKFPSDENQTRATQIARDALKDLREHKEEVTPFMLSYLSNDLGSWIQKYRPNLSEEFEKTIKATVKANASQRIRSLFELKNGDTLAVEHIRHELENQGSLNGLNFWLEELRTRNSKEFEPLASEILTRAGQGQISFETLFWISDIYLQPQTPNALKNRFLTTVVSRTHTAHFTVEPAPQMAYDLLTKILPFVQQSVPDLYDQALNQNVAIRASLSERHQAAEARVKRLNESANPIEDLKSEADSAKSKTERNELLLQAAQLALETKKYDACLDILDRVDLEVAAADQNWQYSIDQILKNLVRGAVAEKLAKLAEKGAARIGSSLTRVEALNLTMRYYMTINDKEAARRILLEAAKIAETDTDPITKAKAFVLLTMVCDQIDRSQKADLLLSGVKALNDFPKPDSTARDKTKYQTYVQRLDNSAYELTKGFKELARQDENSALAFVDKLEKPDLRTFACLGILLGLDGLLTKRNL